ncbi:uncharacterized protein GGS22DRAFT_161205 [Annulohypoxylon maeteangense]|uniref:uncharacterized protein n=1 Tax=Annulohypoxylon maeteangense TaxID=1927788 RepID=UPI0020087328|nr:uncharacterized protein GGS22DRAFT_161205 [Annulohypoxylon maeteangense]KAI0885553.1 hypothetical protein GGS22DRAFT_161205 [Annulohypoxylon maeteangense]
MGWIHNAPDDTLTVGPKIVATMGAMTAVSFCFICLRGYVRCQLVHSLGIDDWIIFATWPLTCAYTIVASIQTTWGLGMMNPEDIPVQNMYTYGHLQYAVSPLYIFSVLGFKLSLIVSYFRFVPQGIYRCVMIFVLVGCVLSNLVCLIVQLDICHPIAKQWDSTITDGRCYDVVAFSDASSAIAIVVDFAVMLLPFPVLIKTKIEGRKKAMLLGLFALGFFVTAIQIIRIQYMKTLVNPFDSGKVNLWSSIEINLGIMVACAPMLSPLFRRRPKSNGNTESSSRGTFELNITKRSRRSAKQRIPSEDNLLHPTRYTSNPSMNTGSREHITPAGNGQIIKETDIVVINQAAPAHLVYDHTGLGRIGTRDFKVWTRRPRIVAQGGMTSNFSQV